jgi:hypothetical protein
MAVGITRFSPTHVEASASFRGRGLFFSRTADGTWWALRLRKRQCTDPLPPTDPSSAGGVREPRRPDGPQLGPGHSLQLP